MEATNKLRGSYRGSFTKLASKIGEFLNSNVDDPDTITGFLAQLLEKYNKLVPLDKEILSELGKDEDCTQKLLDDEIESQEHYNDVFVDLKAKLERRLKCIEIQTGKKDEVEGKLPSRNYKLPKIEIQKFDGNLKDWLSFWGLFKKIHEDENISKEDKFQYLLQSMREGSRAREIVESFPPTADNYKQVIECLQSRFGREDLLVEVYVRELLSLVLKNALGEDQKLPLVKLYDRIETQLRSLKMLGVTSDKYASMLYPLVESSLPINLLRVWERHLSSITLTSENNKFDKLEALMKFLCKEIEGEEKINLARSGFGLEIQNKRAQSRKFIYNTPKHVPTGMELFSSDQSKPVFKDSHCVLCDKQHPSSECKSIKKLSYHEKKQILMKKGLCFRCLRSNHTFSSCRSKGNCLNCGRSHHTILCQATEKRSFQDSPKVGLNKEIPQHNETLANVSSLPHVLLQTLIVKLSGEGKTLKIRAIIDSASQRSYISQDVAKRIGYKAKRKESLKHSLFGGTCTDIYVHDVYKAYLTSVDGSYKCNFDVLSQPIICSSRPAIAPKRCIQELQGYGIHLADYQEGPIELLIGADVSGKLLTGGFKPLPSGLVAIEYKLGWVVMGKTEELSDHSADLVVTSMLTKEIRMPNLWELDTLEITDSSEKLTKLELEEEAKRPSLHKLNPDSFDSFENETKVENETMDVETVFDLNTPHSDSRCRSSSNKESDQDWNISQLGSRQRSSLNKEIDLVADVPQVQGRKGKRVLVSSEMLNGEDLLVTNDKKSFRGRQKSQKADSMFTTDKKPIRRKQTSQKAVVQRTSTSSGGNDVQESEVDPVPLKVHRRRSTKNKMADSSVLISASQISEDFDIVNREESVEDVNNKPRRGRSRGRAAASKNAETVTAYKVVKRGQRDVKTMIENKKHESVPSYEKCDNIRNDDSFEPDLETPIARPTKSTYKPKRKRGRIK